MPSLACIFNYCLSPFKSILHAYVIYEVGADRAQEEKEKQ